MSIKRLKFFQEMLHKLLLYFGKIRFGLPYRIVLFGHSLSLKMTYWNYM